MLRTTSLAARLGLAATLALVAVAGAAAQSAPNRDRREAPSTVERGDSVPGPFSPGSPASKEDAADRQEAIAAEKEAAAAAKEAAAAAEREAVIAAEKEAAAKKAAAEPRQSGAAAVEAPPPAPVDPGIVAATIDPVVEEVRQRLGLAKLNDATVAERAALVAFYADRKNPIWVVGGDFTDRARNVMAEIARADDWGLEARAFALPGAGNVTSITAMADAEIKLSVAVLKYARYARGGRLEPSQVSRNFDQKLSLRDPKVVIETVAGLETPGSYLRALHPKHPQFELLRQALLKARAGAGTSSPQETETGVLLPSSGPVLKLGLEHPDVALLRKRLNVAGSPGLENVFDEDVLAAVKAYQRKGGMRDDGVVGISTRSALNGGFDKSKLVGNDDNRLVVNMERWRWVPEDLGDFYVWDNVPEFQTRIIKKGRMIHTARIIVGRVETQTTIFSANMRYIVFGPEWGVPDSIKIKELLPKLRTTYAGGGLFGFGGPFTDTSILDRQNMRVVYNGKVVDASTIDWSTVDIRKFAFIQAAGPGNALGAVKFRFPNKHDIYMHDTPMRDLFSKTVRAFSHGCIRVQDPGRLAEVLLEEDKGWSAAHVRGMMDKGGNVEVTLTKHIPVHITYFTMVAAEDGTVSSFADIYGHDRRVAAALSGRPLPLESPPSTDLFAQDDLSGKKDGRAKKYKQANDDFFSGLFGN